MEIGIAVDNTLPLHIPSFVRFIQAHSQGIKCGALSEPFRLETGEIKAGDEIRKFSKQMRQSVRTDICLFATTKPFSNNFLFEGISNVYIISFSDWHIYTSLPMSNGLAYFLCQIVLRHKLNVSGNHEEKTGCINDFLWDKTGIDICMRAAFLCEECRSLNKNNPGTSTTDYADILAILNALSAASRRRADILDAPSAPKAGPGFESPSVFLCHNSQDKPAVRTLNDALKLGGVETWFDEERLRPGEVWQVKLEEAISTIGACLVIVGDSGFGPWQDMERRSFIGEFANRGCKLIPVLIGSSDKTPELPLFMKQFMWVDLRKDDGRQLAKLIGALRS